MGLESILNENLGIRDKDNLIEAVVCNVEILDHSFYDLLGPIPTHNEGPHNIKKNGIALTRNHIQCLLDVDHTKWHLVHRLSLIHI